MFTEDGMAILSILCGPFIYVCEVPAESSVHVNYAIN